jgi:hypothetical protein
MREHLFGDTACVTYTKVYTKPGSQAAYSENVLPPSHPAERHLAPATQQPELPAPGSHGVGSPHYCAPLFLFSRSISGIMKVTLAF